MECATGEGKKAGEKEQKNKEGHSGDEHSGNQHVCRQIIKSKSDREKKESVELTCIPDHTLARRGAQQRQEDIFVIRSFEKAFPNRNFGRPSLRLHAQEHGRLPQRNANIDRKDQEKDRK